jgi:large subunit ribosomal protein L24
MGLGINKEDTVYVITGKEKGKKGRVLFVDKGKNRVLVEKVNIIKKHMKPSKKHAQGGIIEKEAPIAISNVLLSCPKCSKPTRIGVSLLESGKKHRTCKKCKEVID